jgi:hypothetical protein
MFLKHFSGTKLLLFTFIVSTISVNAQNGPSLVKVIPPSPNAQAMQKFGDIPVSTYTGIPNISIPLYTVKYKDITVPISINYHASGIKVAEEASQVGLGWSLSAGGMITRNIVGEDDFTNQEYFNGTVNQIMDFADGQEPIRNIQEGCVLSMANRTIPNLPTLDTIDLSSYLGKTPPYDFQPDQYYYNFLNKNGKFILKRNRQAILERPEKIDIINSSVDNMWQVKSDDGSIYDFRQIETYSPYGNPSDTHITGWYLTKITSPAGNVVTFNYTVNPNKIINTIGSYSESTDAQELPVVQNGQVYFAPNTGTQRGLAPARNYNHVALSSIDFINGSVQFYFSDNRLDLPGDQRLDSISVFSKNASGVVSSIPLKTISFSYSYFSAGDADNDYMQSTIGADANYKRLKLSQLHETGYNNGIAVANPPYIFNYYENVSLPSKASFARDHWGYYNGKTSNTSLIPSIIFINSPDYITYILGLQGPERDADPNYVAAFSLSSIQYPTGGSTEFQFEANDYDEERSMVNDHSYFSQQPSVVTKQELLVYDNQILKGFSNDTLDLSDEYIKYDSVLGAAPLLVHLSVAFRFSNVNICSTGATNMLTFDIYDSTGHDLISKDYQYFSQCSGGNTNNCLSCGGSGPVSTYNTDLNLPPGKYQISVHCDNSLTSIQDIRFTFTYYTTVSVPPNNSSIAGVTYAYAGGLRIKKIIDHDALNPLNDKVKKYIYHYFEDRDANGIDEEYTYGRRMAKPQYNSFIWSDEQRIVHNSTGTESLDFEAPHFMRGSDSNIPLNGSAGGAVVGYDQVTVLYGENGEDGKSEFDYYNQPDQVSSYIEQGQLPSRPPYSSTLPYALNGSLLQEIDYKNIGGGFQKTKSITNSYSLEGTSENKVYGMEVRLPTLDVYTDGNGPSAGSLLPCSYYLYSYITLEAEWPHLDMTDEKIFSPADTTKYVEHITSYFYNAKNYMLSRSVENTSKGEQVSTAITYPLDYTIVSGPDAFSLGIKNLQNSHVYNAPIEKYVSKSNPDGTNSRVVSCVLTSFQSTKPFPSVIYSSILSSPSTSFIPATTSSTGSTMDISYKPYIAFDSYDASGNISQQHKYNDINESYIWDYNSSLPIAEVKNALQSDIAYSSFESNGKGNWTYAGIPGTGGGGVTGKQSYLLTSGGISKAGLTASQKYLLSYWSKATVTITGGTQSNSITGKTINGWTYHEVMITGTTSVSITGSTYIDELRLYPSDAQMTSYTYEPLIGVTSQCGADNKIQYYEYDSFSRLQDIKDQDGNILKTFEYHYKQ